MIASAADPGEVECLRRRVQELEAEIVRLTQANRELRQAADTSRNFKASRDAGYILDLELNSWGTL